MYCYIAKSFGVQHWSVFYPKPCYNKPCYKEVEVEYFEKVGHHLPFMEAGLTCLSIPSLHGCVIRSEENLLVEAQNQTPATQL